MKPCPDCIHYTTKMVPDRSGMSRLAEICRRAGCSTAFERSPDGPEYCGAEGRFWRAKPTVVTAADTFSNEDEGGQE